MGILDNLSDTNLAGLALGSSLLQVGGPSLTPNHLSRQSRHGG